jgi:hypothetical protein
VSKRLSGDDGRRIEIFVEQACKQVRRLPKAKQASFRAELYSHLFELIDEYQADADPVASGIAKMGDPKALGRAYVRSWRRAEWRDLAPMVMRVILWLYVVPTIVGHGLHAFGVRWPARASYPSTGFFAMMAMGALIFAFAGYFSVRRWGRNGLKAIMILSNRWCKRRILRSCRRISAAARYDIQLSMFAEPWQPGWRHRLMIRQIS